MTKMVHNERTRMMAQFFHNAALAAFATGVFVPLVTMSVFAQPLKALAALIIGGVFGSAFFYVGQHVLEDMRE